MYLGNVHMPLIFLLLLVFFHLGLRLRDTQRLSVERNGHRDLYVPTSVVPLP